MTGVRPALTHHILRVGDLPASLAFYCGTLGMRPMVETSAERAVLCFAERSPETWLVLRQARREGVRGTLDPGGGDAYWKIGVTLGDVDLAREILTTQGVEVSEPRQFRDIGYLCHLSDPDGFQIELLQHRFAANHRSQPRRAGFALGGPATLGQVTLRVRDAEAALRFYRDRLGLSLLSRQIVAPYGFTLYFLAGTEERPPVDDLDAVENREWLWQRPYTTLELQHRWGNEGRAKPYRTHDDQQVGFEGLVVRAPGEVSEATLLDPDGTRVHHVGREWAA